MSTTSKRKLTTMQQQQQQPKKHANNGGGKVKKRKVKQAKKVKRPFEVAEIKAAQYCQPDEQTRLVVPYSSQFRGAVKGRWLGQTIYQTMCEEFKMYDAAYFRKAIQHERVYLTRKNQRIATKEDTVLTPADVIYHSVHRHEPPVIGHLKVLHVSESLVVIDKPSTMPVHPCGKYRYNSATFILAKEHDLDPLFVVHRLDIATSGVVIFARNKAAANVIAKQIEDKELTKIYLARVTGDLSIQHGKEEFTVDEPVGMMQDVSQRKNCVRTVISVALGGRESTTLVQFLGYDKVSNTSLVQCKPLTGRTHQIRVHLAHLGHPISNDRTYGGTTAIMENVQTSVTSAELMGPDTRDELCPFCERLTSTLATQDGKQAVGLNIKGKESFDSHDMKITPGIYLHARSYSYPHPTEAWTYESPLPIWAQADFVL